MKKFQQLFDFIDAAVKNRKYPESTAQGLKAALKIFQEQLNEDEANSLDKFKENLDQIYQSVVAKNPNFNFSSLATYKSRVNKVLGDYELYGIDPTKMVNWKPKLIIRSKKQGTPKSISTSTEEQIASTESSLTSPVLNDMHRMDLSLRPGVKFTIIVPRDITQAEAQIVKSLIDNLIQK